MTFLLTGPRSRALSFATLVVACAWLAGCGSDSTTVAPPPTAPPAAPAPPLAAAPPAGDPLALETVAPSAETTAQLAIVEAAVTRTRGYGLERPVARTFVTSAGMGVVLAEELADPEVVAEIESERLLLEALGFLPRGFDLLEAYRSLLGLQVLGLYDPTTDAFFVLANAEPGPLELVTYAHEFQHALQDQRFNLETLGDSTEGNRDASLAMTGLIEGDAVYTQSQYIAQELGTAGTLALLRVGNSAPPPIAPAVLLDVLQFPYLQGAAFVQTLARRGGMGAIDAAFAQAPASTEQLLHPEKYAAAEAPVAVRLDVALPAGWIALDEDVLGEYLLQRWLRELGTERGLAAAAGAGWGGDRYQVVQATSGALALLARIEWDSAADAEEFVALFPGAELAGGGMEPRALPGRVLTIAHPDARTIELVLASDRAAAGELARALAATR